MLGNQVDGNHNPPLEIPGYTIDLLILRNVTCLLQRPEKSRDILTRCGRLSQFLLWSILVLLPCDVTMADGAESSKVVNVTFPATLGHRQNVVNIPEQSLSWFSHHSFFVFSRQH